ARQLKAGRKLMRTRLVVVGALVGGVVLGMATLLGGAARESFAKAGCPAGTTREADSGGKCLPLQHPETPTELLLGQAERVSLRSAPFARVAPGAYANAIAERQALVQNKPLVKGVAGTWAKYGHGPLIADSPDYSNVNGLGLHKLSARLDALAYDAADNRLFAAEGTGVLWLSTDQGLTWRSIREGLPSQVVADVGWTTAIGGTVVAVSGDPSFGTNAYTCFGAFWSTDLGATWNKATGIPDGALGFAIAVDPSHPERVYAATQFGLFRSTDGGKSYVNTNLPTGAC